MRTTDEPVHEAAETIAADLPAIDASSTSFAARPLARFYPAVSDLARAAERRLPRFAWDFLDQGIGRERSVARNVQAFDTVEIVPRYMINVELVDPSVTLFGSRFALPIGISPVAMPGVFWPPAERHLARAARQVGVPFSLSTFSNHSIEEIAADAGSSLWFQLYPCRDWAITADLVRRADAAGAQVLLVTVDTPIASKRERELRHGLALPMPITLRLIVDVLRHPRWLAAIARHGQPRLGTLETYIPGGLRGTADGFQRISEMIDTVVRWDHIERLRVLWSKSLVIKGILHPDDARQAIARGADGILVSNHGGRQLDAAPATVDVLPRIAEAVNGNGAVLLDSGIRSGLDVVRAMLRGAHFTLSGRSFYYAMAVLRAAGAEHASCNLR